MRGNASKAPNETCLCFLKLGVINRQASRSQKRGYCLEASWTPLVRKISSCFCVLTRGPRCEMRCGTEYIEDVVSCFARPAIREKTITRHGTETYITRHYLCRCSRSQYPVRVRRKGQSNLHGLWACLPEYIGVMQGVQRSGRGSLFAFVQGCRSRDPRQVHAVWRWQRQTTAITMAGKRKAGEMLVVGWQMGAPYRKYGNLWYAHLHALPFI